MFEVKMTTSHLYDKGEIATEFQNSLGPYAETTGMQGALHTRSIISASRPESHTKA
jgi:hypothetical protein